MSPARLELSGAPVQLSSAVLCSKIAPSRASMVYTASFAFFEAIWEAGVTHCFVNLGSDHPSIIEAIVKGQNEKKGHFPIIVTCPNEVGLFGHHPMHAHSN